MMLPNPGQMLPEAEGKRVQVRLANGRTPVTSWAADGRGGCRWSLTGSPFDIVEYKVL